MKKFDTKSHGFTLIELLVVVLIIGILAAIALPQYKIAVLKSKTREIFIMAKQLAVAQQAYQVATGAYAPSLDELDIAFPCTFDDSNGGYNYYKCPNHVTLRMASTFSQIYFPLGNDYFQEGDTNIVVFDVDYTKGMGANSYCYPNFSPMGCKLLRSACGKVTRAFAGMEFYNCQQ